MEITENDLEFFREALFAQIPDIEKCISKLFSNNCMLGQVIKQKKQIEFSNEEPKPIEYGLSFDKLKQKVKDIALDQTQNETIDRPDKQLDEVENEEELKKWIDAYKGYADESLNSERIRGLERLFRERSFKTILLGKYESRKKQIVLYYKAINKYCFDYGFSPVEVIEAVFARECFVSCLLYEAKKHQASKVKNNKDFKISKGALAAYFEYYYCREKGYKKLEDHYKEIWRDYCSKWWSYSLALPILECDSFTVIRQKRLVQSAYGRLVIGLDATQLILGCKELWELI